MAFTTSSQLCPSPVETYLSPALQKLDLSSCAAQIQSPLFGTLPPEIRNRIFELALSEREDAKRRYAFESYHYRPGFTARRIIATELLLTCRRVWLETRVLPAALAEHVWWLGDVSRGPPECQHNPSLRRHTSLRQTGLSTSPHQGLRLAPATAWRQIRRIRLFAQQWFFEAPRPARLAGFFAALPALPRLEQITLAVRYTDNWFWERDEEPHTRDEAWVWRVALPSASLRRFTIEWESTARKKRSLDEFMAEKTRAWRFRRVDGTPLVWDGRLETERWTGTARFDRKSYRHHGNGPFMEYYIVKATWRPDTSCAGVFQTAPDEKPPMFIFHGT